MTYLQSWHDLVCSASIRGKNNRVCYCCQQLPNGGKGDRGGGAKCFLVVHSGRISDKRHKLEHGKLVLDIRKDIFPWRQTLEQVAQTVFRLDIFRDAQNSAGQKPGLVGFGLIGSWVRWLHEVSTKLNHFMIQWKCFSKRDKETCKVIHEKFVLLACAVLTHRTLGSYT